MSKKKENQTSDNSGDTGGKREIKIFSKNSSVDKNSIGTNKESLGNKS